MANKEKTVVCILGMHRSGTSMISRILNICGLNLGKSQSLMNDSREDNERGHWENLNVLEINEEILSIFGGTWNKPPIFPDNWENDKRLHILYEKAHKFIDEMNSAYDIWGFKEPRTSLTLPFWKKIIPNMRYVIIIRFPGEVAFSLFRRDNIGVQDGILLWLVYWRSILKYTDNENRCFTFFDNYFLNWKDELGKIIKFIDNETLNEEKSSNEIVNFICSNLRHNIISKKVIANLNDNNLKNNLIIDLLADSSLINYLDNNNSLYNQEAKIKELEKKLKQNSQIIKNIKNDIEIMQSSKFWKLRNMYIKMKNKMMFINE